jgi:uncharacterized Zn finger protein
MVSARLARGRKILVYRGSVRGLRALLAMMAQSGTLQSWMAALAEN